METVKRLIIVDFAGTLSLQTVLFGRKERLMRALRASGLDILGYGEPSRFWGELVFPTWEEGALTSKGYARVLSQRLRELAAGERACIREAAYRFVQLYFRHSRIDPGWKPLFVGDLYRNLRARNDDNTPFPRLVDTILIATDHYAECTPFLCRFLHRWGVRCKPIRACKPILEREAPAKSEELVLKKRGGFAPPGAGSRTSPASPRLSPLAAPSPINRTPLKAYIANSADLGAWKKDPSFWEKVNESLPLKAFRQILVIDDFGYNEHRGDPYAERNRVEKRKDSLLRSISSLGASQVEVFPFYLESSVTDTSLVQLYEEYRRLLDRAFLFLDGQG